MEKTRSDSPAPRKQICEQFKNTGSCAYGKNCKFSHDLGEKSKGKGKGKKRGKRSRSRGSQGSDSEAQK